MLKSSLCDYSDAYILVKGTITVNNTAATDTDANNTNKKVIFKNCASLTNCISEINNTQVDNAKDLDIVMPMYNLIEYSDNYSKTSRSLWQYCKDIPAVDNNNAIANFTENLTDSLNFKVKMTGQTGDDGTKNIEIMVSLKYLSNFWRALEMPLINCEVNLILIWPTNCVIASTNVANQNAQNPDLSHLVELSFVLLFENDTQRTRAKGYYLLNVEVKDYNVMINGENFFDQPINNNKITYENTRNVATGLENDYTTGCLLDYPYFRDSHKMILIDLSKQQILNGGDPKAIQQINLTANLDRAGNTRIYFILEETKETILTFHRELLKYCKYVI